MSGRYRIVERLGAGGMGEVYLAEHLQLGRRDAIKVLQPQIARSPQLVARFRREARTINRLHHPHIVSVYDFGQLDDGRLYLSMEYVEGENLGAVVRHLGRLPVARALPILAQLADAMHHAHEHGVVHRDLKPDNIMLGQSRGGDHVKVLDFGLAKIVDPAHDDSVATTEQGAAYGTPQYMAPEQFVGGEHDARTDVYAFGCVAYELLTGAPPFTGRPMAIFEAHVNRTPPGPRAARPEAGISPELDALVLACLEKETRKRPGQRAQILGRLRALAEFPEKPDSGRRVVAHVVGDEAVHTLLGAAPAGIPSVVDTSALRADWRDRLHEAADQLLDAGVDTTLVAIAIADVDAASAELDAGFAAVAEAARRSAHVEQEARELEGSLRFTLGELRFRGDADPTLQQRIEGLEEAIRATRARRDRELEVITAREVELARDVADREAALEAALASLHDALVVAAARAKDAQVDASLAAADEVERRIRGVR